MTYEVNNCIHHQESKRHSLLPVMIHKGFDLLLTSYQSLLELCINFRTQYLISCSQFSVHQDSRLYWFLKSLLIFQIPVKRVLARLNTDKHYRSPENSPLFTAWWCFIVIQGNKYEAAAPKGLISRTGCFHHAFWKSGAITGSWKRDGILCENCCIATQTKTRQNKISPCATQWK